MMNSRSKPTLVFVVNSLKTYVWHRRRLAVHLSKDYEIIVISPKDSSSPPTDPGIRFEWIDIERKGMSPLQDITYLFRLLRAYINIKPNVVHHFTIKPVIYGSIAARIAGVPQIVNSITGMGIVFSGERKYTFLQELVTSLYKISLSNRKINVIFQNPDDRSFFLSKGIVAPKQASIIYGSGVDTHFYSPIRINNNSDRPRVKFLFAARMLKSKGALDMVLASKKLKIKNIDFELTFAGEPDAGSPDSIQLQELLEWERKGLIKYLGFQKDMRELLQDTDVVCLPSFYAEGIPMILLEGMACGKPVITTDAPGCREVVDNNGFKVPSRDVEAISKAMLFFITNPKIINEMGQKSRELAESMFSTEIIFKEIEAIYK